MKTVRMKGVGLTDKNGHRQVTMNHEGVRHYYGYFTTLDAANARARDVWYLFKATGHMPRVEQDGDKPTGECRLIPVEG